MKIIEVECSVCGSHIEIDEELLRIKGASFVCSHECLDENQYLKDVDFLDDDNPMKMPKQKPIKPGEKIEDRVKSEKACIKSIKELPILYNIIERRINESIKNATMKAKFLLETMPSVFIEGARYGEPNERLRASAFLLSTVCRLSEYDAQRLLCEIEALSGVGFDNLTVINKEK
jgi:hypothetical protein